MTRKTTPTLGAADRFVKLLESWKTIAAIVGSTIAFLVLVGIRFETWNSNIAHADDVSALTSRTSAIESSMRDLKADLTLIRQQLFEIAKTTGARQIAPVAPVAGVTP